MKKKMKCVSFTDYAKYKKLYCFGWTQSNLSLRFSLQVILVFSIIWQNCSHSDIFDYKSKFIYFQWRSLFILLNHIILDFIIDSHYKPSYLWHSLAASPTQ